MPGHRASPAATSTSRRRPRPARARPPCASVTSGITPAPITTHVAVELQPALRDDLARRARPTPSKRSSSSPPWTSTPCSSSTPWKKPPTSLPNTRSSVDVLQHHDRALLPERAVSDAATSVADVAAADQHDALGLRGVRADRVRVAERAQVVDARRGRSRRRAAAARSRRSRAAPCRTRPRRLVDSFATRSLGVELHHARARQQLDVLLAPPLVRAEQDVLARLLAPQVPLRQRRPVVGRVGLAAHEQDRAVARPPRAASARSWPPPGRRRSAGSRPSARPRVRRPRARAGGWKRSVTFVLEPGVEHQQHLVARLDHRVGRAARSRCRRAGSRSRASRPAARGPSPPCRPPASPPATSSSMISSRSCGRSSRCTRPYLRHLVLDQAQDQVGGRDRRLDAEQLEVLEVARVVAARDHALDAVLLARDLADQDVVLVVAGHGDRPCRRARCRRARAPTARSRRRTGRCARAPPRPPRSARDRDSTTRHLVALVDQLARRGSSRPCRRRR